MIHNWEYHSLHLDFSSMYDGNDHPSDIDMFYLCRDNTLIIGEIKSNRGHFSAGQKRLIRRLIDLHDGDGVGLYITHDKLVQAGDRVVDVSICPVELLYIKEEGIWRRPTVPIKVKDVLAYYKKRAKMRFFREI